MIFQKTSLALILATLTLAINFPAAAQTMYRCGSVYQDRPCEGKQPEKVVKNYSGSGAVSSVSDAACGERGAKSMKIAQARQVGASMERQMAEAKSGEDRRLVADVYQLKGSTTEVRATIEADCVAEKEKAAQFAALLAASKALEGKNADQAPAKAAPVAADKQARVTEMQAPVDTKQKKRCENISARKDAVVLQRRSGGSASDMDNFNRRIRELDSELQQGGC